jgi:transcriptional regulator with XRE-family HTH domain
MAETALQATAPEPARIGERLRTQRVELGISLRDLARHVGVSASLSSQIDP